ncbi:MAG: alpha-ketoacid dehydrogenase subunit beta [Deinococcaceae bacterium]
MTAVAVQSQELTLVSAIGQALDQALERDSRVLLFGEDVGMGGVFRASDGLRDRYGEDRVFDTPLAESGIVGFAVGLALAGLRPVAEIQFGGFLYPALNQILSHVGKYRHRTRGRNSVPLVVRFPYGGGIKTPEQHGDSPESLLTGIPGIKVVVPSDPARAKGLLLAAIEDPDPVFFMESIKLYRSIKCEVPSAYYTHPLGKARIVTEGKDITLVAYGGMVEVGLEAVSHARESNVSVELIDLETLVPLDTETILTSVAKTGRLVILHEAGKVGGFGAEIAARVAEEAIEYLLSPIVRVAGWDAPYPSWTASEHFYRPDSRRVLRAFEQVLAF